MSIKEAANGRTNGQRAASNGPNGHAPAGDKRHKTSRERATSDRHTYASHGVKRPVLITGGAGFIGTNLAHRLLDSGRPVIIYDNLSRGHRTVVIVDDHAIFREGLAMLVNEQPDMAVRWRHGATPLARCSGDREGPPVVHEEAEPCEVFARIDPACPCLRSAPSLSSHWWPAGSRPQRPLPRHPPRKRRPRLKRQRKHRQRPR